MVTAGQDKKVTLTRMLQNECYCLAYTGKYEEINREERERKVIGGKHYVGRGPAVLYLNSFKDNFFQGLTLFMQ